MLECFRGDIMKNFTQKKILLFLLCFCIFVCMPFTTLAATNSNNVAACNHYPIIMVHGLFGWGNDELMGINYWGGSESLREDLGNGGYEVYTPSIGPVASNWDRACELYAYIKGGTVDYGEAHSKKYGHARYGRTYPGVYPQFGTLSSSNGIQKIHLIGHSMGGETIRTFVQLLENGSMEEILNTPKDNISPLFTGGKSWVDSVTTIATPHDGSPVAHEKYDIEPFTHQFIAALAAENGNINCDNLGLDFKLDQWGLERTPGESYRSYFNRVMTSNIWKKTTDLSLWDLAPEGASALNSWVKANNDVYYFSIACVDTHKDLLTGYQVPNLNINPILIKSSFTIGSYTNNKPGDVKVDNTWWRNDGIVSVISAVCPHVGSTDKMVPYDGTPKKGIWNYLGEIKSVDHLEVVAMDKYRSTLEPKYFDLAKMLSNLPK